METPGVTCNICGGYKIVLMGTTVDGDGWFMCDECDQPFEVIASDMDWSQYG